MNKDIYHHHFISTGLGPVRQKRGALA